MIPEHELVFHNPIRHWDEAVPLGNGLMGCLVYGDGAPLRLSLDRGDLWDTRPAPEWDLPHCNYDELIRLVRAGDQNAMHERFEFAYAQHPGPTKIPAGGIELHYGRPCDTAASRLSLAEATAYVELAFGDKNSEIRAILHADERYGFVSVRGSQLAPRIELVPHMFHAGPDSAEPQGPHDFPCFLLDYPPPEFGSQGRVKWFRQKTRQELEFAIIAAQREVDHGGLDVAYTVATYADGTRWFEDAVEQVTQALQLGFDEARHGHLDWWRSFWSASSVTLPDKDEERSWYVNNYLFGSCSRKGAPPMPLQGVWTADTGSLPPWKGDYHNDLNTQMSYQHFLMANHLREGESFINFLWGLRDAARGFARKFIRAPGLCLPGVMSIDGQPLGGWAMYTLSITNHAWLCKSFADYWRHTLDREFLEEKAYPFLKESAECLLSRLEPGTDGKLRLPLSSSPEIHNNQLAAWLTPNSNYDLSLLIYLFKALAEMADALGNTESAFWREKLAALPELAVGDDGGLMISPDEDLTESHRHHSHAMAIYPLKLLDYHASERERAIIDATIQRLQALGTGHWCGYSFSWMAALYAMQGNGEGAAYQLKLFRECFCSDNGFHLNGDFRNRGVSAAHYRPFTLEGNMLAADALQQMLLQTRGGVMHLFPAIPESWRRQGASFERLRGEGGVLVSAVVEHGSLKSVTLESERGGELVVYDGLGEGEPVSVELAAGERRSLGPGLA